MKNTENTENTEKTVIRFGAESDLYLAGLIGKALIAAIIIAITAVVLVIVDGISTRTGILLGGAILSPVVLFAFLAVILQEVRTGTVKRGVLPALARVGGVVPFAFGCYLIFYEGFLGFVRLFSAFTFSSFLASIFYVIAGYLIAVGIYRMREFRKDVAAGRIVISDAAATEFRAADAQGAE